MPFWGAHAAGFSWVGYCVGTTLTAVRFLPHGETAPRSPC